MGVVMVDKPIPSINMRSYKAANVYFQPPTKKIQFIAMCDMCLWHSHIYSHEETADLCLNTHILVNHPGVMPC